MFSKKQVCYGALCFLFLCGLFVSPLLSSHVYAKGSPKQPVNPGATSTKSTPTPSTPNTKKNQATTPKLVTRSGNDTVVFVHGWSKAAWPNIPGAEAGLVDKYVTGCNDYWGDALNYMNGNHGNLTWGRKDFRTIQYYNADTGCSNGWDSNNSSNLHSSEYTSHCVGYPSGYNSNNDGAWNEDLYHVTCLFAWYLYYNFGQYNWSVEIVAHSMGGLIVHNAIYQVQYRSQLGTGNRFPPTLGHISDVVDFNSPHGGHQLNAAFQAYCNLSVQCKQMNGNSSFTQEMLSSRARNSQAGGTDWTLLGSECDSVVSAGSAIQNWDVGHKIVYASGGSACYSHSGALSDTNESLSALQYWCDWQDAGAVACNIGYPNFPHYDVGAYGLYDMLNALWNDQW
jgi:Predicted acetyltransferases and hydrolases with the alpha/beta hydrolase fold